MKKLLAILIALMMLTVTCVAGADSAIHIVTTYEFSEEAAAMLGATASDLELIKALSSDLLLTSNGYRSAVLYNGDTLLDFAIEVDGDKIYADSTLLDQPLYLNVGDLAKLFPQLAPLFIDWNSFANDMNSLTPDLTATAAAITNVTVINSGNTIIIAITADQLCAIIDAFTGDMLATQGLDAVMEKYFGITDLAGNLRAAADQLKAACRELDGSIVITVTETSNYGGSSYYASQAIGISVPLRTASWNLAYVSESSYDYNTWDFNSTMGMILKYAANNGHEAREYSLIQENGSLVIDVTETLRGDTVTLFSLKSTDNGFAGTYRVSHDGSPVDYALSVLPNGAELKLSSNGSVVTAAFTAANNGGKLVINLNGQEQLVCEAVQNENVITLSLTADAGIGEPMKLSYVITEVDNETITIEMLMNDQSIMTETLKGETIDFNGELISNKDAALNIFDITEDQLNTIITNALMKLLTALPMGV